MYQNVLTVHIQNYISVAFVGVKIRVVLHFQKAVTIVFKPVWRILQVLILLGI